MKRIPPRGDRSDSKSAPTGEFELISKLTSGWSYRPNVLLGPGDDASAVVFASDEKLAHLQTTDLLIEDIHFRKGWGTPFQLGWKSLAVNLSDVAAMGGTPRHAHLSLAIPASWAENEILAFKRGFQALARRYQVELLGGDLSASPGPLMISVMLDGVVSTEKILRRNGAQPGDFIWVSGTLGDAAAGLKLLQHPKDHSSKKLLMAFLQPQPEVELGRLLAASGAVHALIDVSDGVAGDLGHILKQSQVGAILSEDKLPLSSALKSNAKLPGWDIINLALQGGEDYRLLGCTPVEKMEHLNQQVSQQFKRSLFIIGEIRQSGGLQLQTKAGKMLKIEPAAFDHFKA